MSSEIAEGHQEIAVAARASTIAGVAQARIRVLLAGLLLPILGAAILCGFASLWPVRLDARALQDVNRLVSLGLPVTSGTFVFFSRDNSIESARTATFGLRQLAFPDGSVFWAVPKEQCNGVWSSGFVAVDSASNAYVVAGGAEGALQWSPVPQISEEVRQLISEAVVLYDSDSTRLLFQLRWPFLKTSNKVAVLTDSSSTSSFRLRRPASEFSAARLLRMAALLGSYFAILLVLLQSPGLQQVDRWLIAAGAVFLAVGLIATVEYLLQWTAPLLVRWMPALLWGAGLATAAIKAGKANLGSASKFRLPAARTIRLVLLYGVAVYAVLFLIRLDFDGDFFNNWLPQGRFHYLLGRHDPTAIIGQGSMQGASYPPGYGIELSTLMWASAMNPTESFLPGGESSFAILMYRLFVFVLNLALMVLLVTHLKQIAGRESDVWLAGVALILLLIPSTAGKHIGSETLLFPMMAGSILVISAGRRIDSPMLTGMGLAIGAMATLIKTEGTLIFLFAVLPWLVADKLPRSGRPSRRAWLKWAAACAIGMLPVLIWRLTVKVHNDFFAPVTWSRFVSSLHVLPGLANRAARGMLDDGRLVFLGLALPAAIVFRLRDAWRRPSLLVPAGLLVLFTGFIGVFLFANLDPQTYLDTSYTRLMMVPTFGAILYSAEAVQLAKTHRAGADAL